MPEKPALDEVYLAHVGVKGMRWGKRKDGKPGSNRKRALQFGGAALLAGGAAVAVVVIARNGKLPFRSGSPARVASGKLSASRIADQAAWKKSVSSLRNDIKQGHADQDRWMRSLGLGASVNKKASPVNMNDLNDVRRALDDPNHVWEL